VSVLRGRDVAGLLVCGDLAVLVSVVVDDLRGGNDRSAGAFVSLDGSAPQGRVREGDGSALDPARGQGGCGRL